MAGLAFLFALTVLLVVGIAWWTLAGTGLLLLLAGLIVVGSILFWRERRIDLSRGGRPAL